MALKDWTVDMQQRAVKAADDMAITVETYVEFIEAANEALTVAANWRALQRMRQRFGI